MSTLPSTDFLLREIDIVSDSSVAANIQVIASGYELALRKDSPGWTDGSSYTIDYSTAYAGALAS